MKSRKEIAREEATRDPIFLLQSKKELLDQEDATEAWQTESVWLTREEAERAYGKRTSYHWRVCCVNAEGDLARLLLKHLHYIPSGGIK